MPAATHIGELIQPAIDSARPGAARGQRPGQLEAQSPTIPLHDTSLNAHASYHNAPHFSSPALALHHQQIQMLAFPPPSPHPWHRPVHMVSSNPYPMPPHPTQNAHKVWILDCRSCGTFLTNRGMRAVLLLRPHVPLYSTDALPVNCSAYPSNTEALGGPSSRPTPARTCECLTQSLCCHACGASVGYMIVIPCSRCTSSITTTNRATNGHRFVFHSKEVLGLERHYIGNEPGIAPFSSLASGPVSPLCPPPFYPPPLHRHTYVSPALPSHVFHHPHHYQTAPPHLPAPASTLATASPRSEYLPTPPLEFAELLTTPSPTGSFPFPYSLAAPPSQHPQPSPPLQPQPYPPHAYVSSRPTQSPFPIPCPDQKDGLPVQRLLDGDILYWHHLARNGEIPGVAEDCRARSGCGRAGGRRGSAIVFDR